MAMSSEPTDQQLRDACARMAQRFGWTEDFDVVMQDARRGRLVRLAVAHPSASDVSTARATRPSNRPPFIKPPVTGAPFLDRKRAASGERDDE